MGRQFALVAALVLGSAVLGTASSPADGRWKFSMSSPMGSVTADVELKSDGETLSGTFSLDGGRSWTVEEGIVKGNEIAFVVNRDRPAGGTMRYEMKGTVEGDTTTGTASAMGQSLDWTMTRAR